MLIKSSPTIYLSDIYVSYFQLKLLVCKILWLFWKCWLGKNVNVKKHFIINLKCRYSILCKHGCHFSLVIFSRKIKLTRPWKNKNLSANYFIWYKIFNILSYFSHFFYFKKTLEDTAKLIRSQISRIEN